MENEIRQEEEKTEEQTGRRTAEYVELTSKQHERSLNEAYRRKTESARFKKANHDVVGKMEEIEAKVGNSAGN